MRIPFPGGTPGLVNPKNPLKLIHLLNPSRIRINLRMISSLEITMHHLIIPHLRRRLTSHERMMTMMTIYMRTLRHNHQRTTGSHQRILDSKWDRHRLHRRMTECHLHIQIVKTGDQLRTANELSVGYTNTTTHRLRRLHLPCCSNLRPRPRQYRR